jgi:nicotinate-nucleotide pyrophosphorylase (carboxylating)
MQLDKARVLPIIKAALKEDIGKGDVTTQALVDKSKIARCAIVVREDCVVCGLQIAEWTMAQIDYSVRFKPNCNDGYLVGAGKEIAFIEGRLNAILRAERTMINFLTFLSGIATKTKQFVDKVRPHGTKVMDTRKTLPLLRYLEKYAVATGGGTNHRMGLYDQVLIKDNHIAGTRDKRPGSRGNLKDMVAVARNIAPKGMKIEIEVESVEEFSEVLPARPDIIMLDNMKPDQIKECVGIRSRSNSKTLLEVSGGITLDNVEDYARTGVDMVSVGNITASVKAIDMSLDVDGSL